MIDINAVKEPINAVKIPSTPIIDTVTGTLAREWLYFFNEIGNVVDQAIAANLTEMTKSILESADTAELSLHAQHPFPPTPEPILDSVNVYNNGGNTLNELSSTIDIANAYMLSILQKTLSNNQSALTDLQTTVDSDRSNNANSVIAINTKIEDIEAWQLLTTN